VIRLYDIGFRMNRFRRVIKQNKRTAMTTATSTKSGSLITTMTTNRTATTRQSSDDSSSSSSRRSCIPMPPPASFSSFSPVHVIKKCSHLEAPAIFFSFKDCQFYLDLQDKEEEEEDEKGSLEKSWEYDLFDTVEEALAFLRSDEKPSSSSPRQNQGDENENENDDESDDKNNQNEKRKRNEQEEEDDYETKRMKRLLHRDRQSSHQRHIQVFEKNLALLQQFKQDYGDCDIHPSKREYESSDTTSAPRIQIDWEKYDGLRIWVSRIRSHIVKYQNVATRESSKLTGEQVEQLFDVGFVMEPRRNKHPDMKPLDYRLKRSLNGTQKNRAKRFEKNLARLQQFKQEYGHCDVPFQKSDSGSEECFQKRDNNFLDNISTGNGGGSFSAGGAASQSATTSAEVGGGDNDGDGNSGTDAGETDPTRTMATASAVAQPPPPRSTIDWEKYDGLGGWVSRMRNQIERYQNVVSRKSSRLTKEQVDRLLDVGFVMVPRRSKPIRAGDRVRKSA
jgi:ribosomal protein S8